MEEQAMVEDLAARIGTVTLNDARLEARFHTLVARLAEHPEQSLPQACETWSETIAAYRFFANAAVAPEAIRAGLARATVARCQDEERVLVIQDTTSLDYTSHHKTTGCGPLEHPEQQGLFVHTSLAVSGDGVPLGIIDQQVWARDPEAVGSRHQRTQRPVEGKESAKWLHGLRETETRLGATVATLTVADREADVYELFALAQTLHGDWLIRARHDRKLVGQEGRLLAAVEQAPVVVQERLEMARAGERPARVAELTLRCATVTVQPPPRAVGAIAHWWQEHPQTERLAPAVLTPVRVGVVLVSEVHAPKGVEPLRWLLLSSLPVETAAQALACARIYRLRWLVERYHFVLKSGCRIERLQLRQAERLERALAVYAAVAWWLLWLSYLARAEPEAPCTVVLEPPTWQALWATHHKTLQLPAEPPDLHTVVRWIAQLGGFLARKGDGEPGVQTLWRGLRRLEDITATWALATQLLTAPPSSPSINTYV
jgi:Transposase DNA-binding/Transposase Tn5 dimerisation domain